MRFLATSERQAIFQCLSVMLQHFNAVLLLNSLLASDWTAQTMQ